MESLVFIQYLRGGLVKDQNLYNISIRKAKKVEYHENLTFNTSILPIRVCVFQNNKLSFVSYGSFQTIPFLF